MMRLHKRSHGSLVLVAAVLAAGAALAPTLARANEIGINFQGGATAAGGNLAPTASAGVVPQTNFNNVVGTKGASGALIDNTGAATATTVTFGGYNAGVTTNASGDYRAYGTTAQPNADQQLLNGELNIEDAGNGIQATVNNIPYSSYNVYAYLSLGTGRLGNVALYATPQASNAALGTPEAGPIFYKTLSPTAPPYYVQSTATAYNSTTNPESTYVEFAGITGSSFSLLNLNHAGGGGSEVGLAGIQIVDASNGAIPEPATLGILALGATAFLARRKRRLA